jgi:hypothetical protein
MIQVQGADLFLNPKETAPLGQSTADPYMSVGMTDLFEILTPEDNENIAGYWASLEPELEHLASQKRNKVLFMYATYSMFAV